MPTVDELKDAIRKHKGINCPPLSKQNKKSLMRIVDELGLKVETKPKKVKKAISQAKKANKEEKIRLIQGKKQAKERLDKLLAKKKADKHEDEIVQKSVRAITSAVKPAYNPDDVYANCFGFS